MKQLAGILIFLFSIYGFSQENKKEKFYEFDYFLEYSGIGGECFDKECKFYMLVNSKNNRYNLTFHKKGKDSLNLYFRDFYNLFSTGEMLAVDFAKPDTLDFKCGYKKIIRDNYANEIVELDDSYKLNYHKLKDTLINNKKAVKFGVIKERKLKKGKIDVDDFIVIEKHSDFKKINFKTYFELEQWNKSKIDFQGLLVYKKIKITNKNLKDWKVKLLSYSKIKKVLKVNINCD